MTITAQSDLLGLTSEELVTRAKWLMPKGHGIAARRFVEYPQRATRVGADLCHARSNRCFFGERHFCLRKQNQIVRGFR